MTNNLLQCFVRNDGKPTLSMTAMISGSMSNVILDYLFIFPLHMGIFGAILATGFAPVISIIVLLPYFIGTKNGFHYFIILGLEGNIGVAAFGVITVISLVVIAIYTGLSQGIQPIISVNHGTGNKAGVKTILRYAMITVFLLSGVIYMVIFLGASQLVFIFNSERNEMLQTLAVTGLKLYFLACPFIGFKLAYPITECVVAIVGTAFYILTKRKKSL